MNTRYRGLRKSGHGRMTRLGIVLVNPGVPESLTPFAVRMALDGNPAQAQNLMIRSDQI